MPRKKKEKTVKEPLVLIADRDTGVTPSFAYFDEIISLDVIYDGNYEGIEICKNDGDALKLDQTEITEDTAVLLHNQFNEWLDAYPPEPTTNTEQPTTDSKTSLVEVQHNYTEAEINEIAHQLSHKISELSAIKDSKKQVVAKFNAEIEAIETEIIEMGKKIEVGHYSESISCTMEYNYEAGVVIYRNNDGEEVQRKPLPAKQDTLLKSRNLKKSRKK